MILLLLLLSARAGDTGVSEALEAADYLAASPGESGGFLSSPSERRALIEAVSGLILILMGGGGVAGAAVYRRRTGLPASSLETLNDPRFVELLEVIKLQGERIASLESQYRSDPRTDLLMEQQNQIDRALNQTATMVELMYDSLSMAPKLAAAKPEEVSV